MPHLPAPLVVAAVSHFRASSLQQPTVKPSRRPLTRSETESAPKRLVLPHPKVWMWVWRRSASAQGRARTRPTRRLSSSSPLQVLAFLLFLVPPFLLPLHLIPSLLLHCRCGEHCRRHSAALHVCEHRSGAAGAGQPRADPCDGSARGQSHVASAQREVECWRDVGCDRRAVVRRVVCVHRLQR